MCEKRPKQTNDFLRTHAGPKAISQRLLLEFQAAIHGSRVYFLSKHVATQLCVAICSKLIASVNIAKAELGKIPVFLHVMQVKHLMRCANVNNITPEQRNSLILAKEKREKRRQRRRQWKTCFMQS